MGWQSIVPNWVLSLAASYAIPDDAVFVTGIKVEALSSPRTPQETYGASEVTLDYPGFIPDFDTKFHIETETEGISYELQFRKAVGFYGVLCEVVNYDDTKLNKWAFPLLRRNFGFVSLSRNNSVIADKPIHYGSQYITCEAVLGTLGLYKDDFNQAKLLNNADDYVANRVSLFLYPSVSVRVSFLPVYEVWAVNFLGVEGTNTCEEKIAALYANGWTNTVRPAIDEIEAQYAGMWSNSLTCNDPYSLTEVPYEVWVPISG